MDNKENTQDLELDKILDEFHDLPGQAEELPAVDTSEVDKKLAAEIRQLDQFLEELPEMPEVKVEIPSVEDLLPAGEDPPVFIPGDTIRIEDISKDLRKEAPQAASSEAEIPTDATVRIPVPETLPPVPEAAGKTPAQEAPAQEADPAEAVAGDTPMPPPPIEFKPRSRLQELKKKLVAGPEKRYYELTEVGVGRLQIAILISVILVGLCAAVTTMFYLDMVPENRLRFVIFSQVLAMLVSALLGSHLILDTIGELFRGRFTANTLLLLTLAACCVDAVFCLRDLRVPCCAAFSLEMTMALWARYHRRTTEMSQMDTMRKANRLNSLVKEPDYFEGKPGILRGQGQVDDFMDTYAAPSGPEKAQSFYAFLCLVACVTIAVLAGIKHGTPMGVQILSVSLLVAFPASFFVAITRPTAVLERRLHMVGTVFCGWRGVKKLCGKAAFPLRDEDLFPAGSTKLNGVKFYGDRNPDEVISYTTSLLCAAGGGLVPVFRQLLASRNGLEHPVVNFHNYGSGGIGGEVCDEPVLLGSLNFLQDMGVEIPEGTMVNQAVYAAIDGQLCAVFAISYAKMRSAAAGMVTLCSHRKLTPVLTGGDFMLTESLLRGKFRIRTRRVALPSQEVRRQLAAHEINPESPVLALTTREDLVSSAYAVSGARALRTACKLGVLLHLLGGILGVLIMLVLAYLGSTELLTPTHVLLYQLVWLIPGLLVTEWTRTV